MKCSPATPFCCEKGVPPYCAVSKRSCVFRRDCVLTACFKSRPHCCHVGGKYFCTETELQCALSAPTQTSRTAGNVIRAATDTRVTSLVQSSGAAMHHPITDVSATRESFSALVTAKANPVTSLRDFNISASARKKSFANVPCGESLCNATKPFCCHTSPKTYCTTSREACQPYLCGNAPCPSWRPKCCRAPSGPFCLLNSATCPPASLCGLNTCDRVRPYCCEAGPTKYCAVSERSCVYKEPCGNTLCFRSSPHCCADVQSPFCVANSSFCPVQTKVGLSEASTSAIMGLTLDSDNSYTQLATVSQKSTATNILTQSIHLLPRTISSINNGAPPVSKSSKSKLQAIETERTVSTSSENTSLSKTTTTGDTIRNQNNSTDNTGPVTSPVGAETAAARKWVRWFLWICNWFIWATFLKNELVRI